MNTIVFNGKPMPERVGITSFVVSTPTVSFRSIDIPMRRGQTRAGRKYGGRAIQAFVVLTGTGLEDNLDIVRELTEWLQTDEPAPLFLPDQPNAYIMAECDTFPPLDLGHMDTEVQIAWTCHNPDFVEVIERTAKVGREFVVGGTLEVFPTITWEISADVENPSWMLDDKPLLTLDGSLSAGRLVIDCEREKVTLDGEDITQMATLESTIGITLAPGKHRLTGDGGVVHWHNATLWGCKP